MKPNGDYWDEMWSPVTGCDGTLPCYERCWARAMCRRYAKQWKLDPKEPFKPAFHEDWLDKPLRVRKPTVFFCCGMGELFVRGIGLDNRLKVMERMLACPHHVFVLLTKRIDQAEVFFNALLLESEIPKTNLVLGTSVSTQMEWDKRVPVLCQIPAWRRVVSIEPMLGPIHTQIYQGKVAKLDPLRGWSADYIGPDEDGRAMYDGGHETGRIHGIILGGESGPAARPLHPGWARSVRDQCEAAGVKFYFKQWGEWGWSNFYSNDDSLRMDFLDRSSHRIILPDGTEWDHMLHGQPPPGTIIVARVGKKAAGRLLDGREHNDLCWQKKAGTTC
ncbi:MAG TPA: DUF5131 family protein [Acidobacteriaceae bacterium]|nr:DUF5131 family protein [Acidobacteriaceae bacterium]